MPHTATTTTRSVRKIFKEQHEWAAMAGPLVVAALESTEAEK